MTKYRLTDIVTKTGDSGESGLADGSRAPKDAPEFEALGCIDELNAQIGLLRVFMAEDARICEHDYYLELHEQIESVQHQLFNLGADIALPGSELVNEEDTLRLEQFIKRFNQLLPPLENFVLPTGEKASVQAHVARTVCRRAERRLVTLNRHKPFNQAISAFINRLSDTLFIFCRLLSLMTENNETLWQQPPAQQRNNQ